MYVVKQYKQTGEQMSKEEASNKKKCTKCGKNGFLVRDYYMSNSDKHADSRIGVCKQCINKSLETDGSNDFMKEEFISKIQDTLLEMNRPYIHSIWLDSIEEVKGRKHPQIFGIYLKNVLLNHKNKNWRDSEFAIPSPDKDTSKLELKNKTSSKQLLEKKHNIELDTQNEKDVLRLLGYDPFEYETEEDKPMLFNRLIDYLSEDILEDGYRLSSAISIVRTFNQVDRLDAAMANASPSDVGALITAKEKLHRVINNIAKENGISIGANAKNSAGSGTLTGIMKQLQDYDFHEASVNLFDIETAKGIRQVADLSNQSIMQQLNFDENSMSEMIRDQRELIEDFEERAKRFEEKNRLLRVEIDKRDKEEKVLKEKIEELERRLNELLERG